MRRGQPPNLSLPPVPPRLSEGPHRRGWLGDRTVLGSWGVVLVRRRVSFSFILFMAARGVLRCRGAGRIPLATGGGGGRGGTSAATTGWSRGNDFHFLRLCFRFKKATPLSVLDNLHFQTADEGEGQRKEVNNTALLALCQGDYHFRQTPGEKTST